MSAVFGGEGERDAGRGVVHGADGDVERIAILGAGDLGRTLAHHVAAQPGRRPVRFFDDLHRGQTVAGLPVEGGIDDALAAYRAGRFDGLAMAIGYKHLRPRAEIFARLRDAGVPFPPLVHPSCYVDRGARLGDGVVLFPGCVLDDGAEVGDNTLLNTGCTIAHDSKLGRHGFLGPGVTIAGFVEVGDFAFLGVGTVVIDSVRLGEGCQTGGGAVVIDDLEGGVLAVGVPARPVRRT